MACCARAPPPAPQPAAWAARPPPPPPAAWGHAVQPPQPSSGGGGAEQRPSRAGTPTLAGEMLRIQRARSSGAAPTAICGFKVAGRFLRGPAFMACP